MKNCIACFAMAALISACGALSHSKSNADGSTPKNTNHNKMDQGGFAASPMILKNLDSGPHEWVSRSGEKFMVLGTFSRSSVSALIGDSDENVKVAGTLRATWSEETYAPHFEGDDPKPEATQNIVNYPKTDVYFTQTIDEPNTVSLAIAESKYEALPARAEPVRVQYNDKVICIQFAIVEDHSDSFFPLTGSLANCDATDCTYTWASLHSAVMHITRADLEQKYPHSTCQKSDRIPTERANLTNTHAITAYEVLLKSEYLKVAPSLQFKPTR
jgi:hypothetical protein